MLHFLTLPRTSREQSSAWSASAQPFPGILFPRPLVLLLPESQGAFQPFDSLGSVNPPLSTLASILSSEIQDEQFGNHSLQQPSLLPCHSPKLLKSGPSPGPSPPRVLFIPKPGLQMVGTEDTSLQLWSVTDPANSGSTAVAHQSLFACLVVFLTQTHRDWARLFPICLSSRLLLNSQLGSWEEPGRWYHGQGQPSGVWAPHLRSIPPSFFTKRGRSSPARLPHEPTHITP